MKKLTGPISYENWIAAKRTTKSQYAFECPLFTDVHVTGEITDGYGPYQFLNTTFIVKPLLIAPSIILRVEEYIEVDTTKKNMIKTDTSIYHGGMLFDEIAALLSLCLGMRVKAGGATRQFEADGDPRGRPVRYSMHDDPVFIKTSRHPPIIPDTARMYNLNEAYLLKRYPELSPIDASALVKAARLYQEAFWISESEPSLSWIFFVSAVETAANHWRSEKESSIDRLKASIPKLVQLLEKYSEELPLKVANMISDYLGSTRKFLDFILHFFPSPPPKRPPKPAQISWNPKEMEKSLRIIYGWRSKALHGGTPFPLPMCLPPFPQRNYFREKPPGLASQSAGGVWTARDTPMYLHIFEHIVRHSLLLWWDSMAKND